MYANIHFQFVQDVATAAIWISVSLDGKSSSCIGTDALHVPAGQETMHFGWLTAASSQAEYDSVVLHEFGHALGLLHEHQIPSSTIIWNKPVVYQYCTTKLGWSAPDVDHNVFEKYTPEQAIFTRMDPKSIMMYSYPGTWTLNVPPISTPWNYSLSDADKQFIALQYPVAINANGATAPR
jgi:serralysin